MVLVKRVNPSWLVFSEGFYVGRAKRLLKRILDIMVAAAILFLADDASRAVNGIELRVDSGQFVMSI